MGSAPIATLALLHVLYKEVCRTLLFLKVELGAKLGSATRSGLVLADLRLLNLIDF